MSAMDEEEELVGQCGSPVLESIATANRVSEAMSASSALANCIQQANRLSKILTASSTFANAAQQANRLSETMSASSALANVVQQANRFSEAMSASSALANVVQQANRFSEAMSASSALANVVQQANRFSEAMSASSALANVVQQTNMVSEAMSASSTLANYLQQANRFSEALTASSALTNHLRKVNRFSDVLGTSYSLAARLAATQIMIGNLVGVGQLNALELLGTGQPERTSAPRDTSASIVEKLDLEDPVARRHGLLEAMLLEVQKVTAQRRSAKARVFDAMNVIQFVWTLWTILSMSQNPEWVAALRTDIQKHHGEFKELNERLERLEEMQRSDSANMLEVEQRVTELLEDLGTRAGMDLAVRVSVVQTKAPLRWSPNKNGHVLCRVAPGAAALEIHRKGKWAYVLLLDQNGGFSRGGWILRKSLSFAK